MSSPSVNENTQAPSRPLRVPGLVYLLGMLAVAVGAASFILGIQNNPVGTWRAFFINVLFWTSVGCGGFIWSVVFRITRTTWSPYINRLSHAFVEFLPFLLLMLILLYFGRRLCLPWALVEWGDRAGWMNPETVFQRDVFCLFAFAVLGFIYVRIYLYADNPNTSDEVLTRLNRRLSFLSVFLALVFIALFTLLAFDLVMPLTPGWYSALFGWYFALGAMYVGMASLIITAIVFGRWLGIRDQFPPKRLQDMGNLLMGFAMAMTYFFYSQALVIWYENLPPETSYAIPRINFQPWRAMSWVLFAVCYVGPFALLVIRELKENTRTLLGVAFLVFLAVWYERYMLVVPSLVAKPGMFPVLQMILIGVGFLGVLVLTVIPFLARYHTRSKLDTILEKERAQWA